MTSLESMLQEGRNLGIIVECQTPKFLPGLGSLIRPVECLQLALDLMKPGDFMVRVDSN